MKTSTAAVTRRVTSGTPVLGRAKSLVFGPKAAARLPARVETAIRRQEQNSEIVICFVQLGAIVFFAIFYAVSPKTFPADAPFEPVPVTLTAYAAFTGLRLYLSLRRRLPEWFLAASVIADVAVLMVTIWSFHLQYDQPPGLYLKAPTVLYVFIIIALRALRFDPRWLVLAGVASCIGWLSLVAYAIGSSEVTHSYVEYMTSLKILVGAEVDKMASLLAFTAVLTLAIVRAQRLLVRAVAEETAAMELSRFFSRDIAETIKAADQPIRAGDGVLREAAAMFVDLRGFTTLGSNLDPRNLVALLGEYQRIVAGAIQEHGGSITTYLGDGIMITFGATRPSDSYAADAIAAGETVLERLRRWRSERERRGLPAPGVGIGIASGTVLYGAIGDESRLEYAVIGDAVNRAAKVQNHTKSLGVQALVTLEAAELARAQGLNGTWRILRNVGVGGLSTPLDLVVLE